MYVMYSCKIGAMKCTPNCTCGRHRPRTSAQMPVPCPPDCTCGRHRKPPCPSGCQCGKHDPAGRSHPCPPGCTCDRHKPQVRKGVPCPPDCTCGHHSRPDLGDGNGYMNLHRRVRRLRGKAAEHACVRCAENGTEKRAYHWAQIHGTDGKDPWADYMPLCVSCHRRYDDSDERRQALSRSWTPERKAELGARTRRLVAEGRMGPSSHRKRRKVAE